MVIILTSRHTTGETRHLDALVYLANTLQRHKENYEDHNPLRDPKSNMADMPYWSKRHRWLTVFLCIYSLKQSECPLSFQLNEQIKTYRKNKWDCYFRNKEGGGGCDFWAALAWTERGGGSEHHDIYNKYRLLSWVIQRNSMTRHWVVFFIYLL